MSRHHHLALLLAVCAVASAAEENATGFLAARLGGDRAEAEDLLQQSIAKALSAAAHLRDEERLVPWFYQLLRNALIDRVRSRQAASARARRWAERAISEAEATRQLCACDCKGGPPSGLGSDLGPARETTPSYAKGETHREHATEAEVDPPSMPAWATRARRHFPLV